MEHPSSFAYRYVVHKANLLKYLHLQHGENIFRSLLTRYRYIGNVIAMMDLKTARARRKLTQDQLAEKTGLPQTTISDIERGVIKKPSWDAVARIARALDYDPEKLFPLADQQAAS